jgi:hypothetical protein
VNAGTVEATADDTVVGAGMVVAVAGGVVGVDRAVVGLVAGAAGEPPHAPRTTSSKRTAQAIRRFVTGS